MKRWIAKFASRMAPLAALAAPALLAGWPSVALAGNNPYESLARQRQPDIFNARLSDAEKAAPKPVRGGQMTRRLSADFEKLNPITSTGAESRYVLKYMTEDTFAKQDPEFFEFVPWVADWWSIQDIIEMEDGSRLVGLITEMDGSINDPTRLVFSEGAQLLTVGKVDAAEGGIDVAGGRLKLRDGREFEGDITEFHYILEIAVKGEEPREVPIDGIKTVEVLDLGKTLRRKAVNKHCLFLWHMRENPAPTWHDGQPLRPEDAVLCYKTIMNPYVENAQRLSVYFKDVKTFEKAGDRLVRVELSKPYFLMKAQLAEMYLLPSHAINYEAYEGDDQAYGDYFNKLAIYQPGDQPMIGNGPYKRSRWMSGELELVRNDDYWPSKANPPLPYWAPQQPYLDKISYRVIADTAAALVELKKGSVDVDFDVEPSQWASASTNTPEFLRNIVRAKNLTPSYTYVGWNLERPLFQDKEVRQALTMLMPRDRILNEVHFGLGRVQPSHLFLEGPVHDPNLEPWPFNPDGFKPGTPEYEKWKHNEAAVKGAKWLLRKSRWLDRDGDGILDHPKLGKFEFTYQIHTAREYHAKVADIMKEDLGKYGIRVNIEKNEWSIFVERADKRQFDSVRFAWATEIDPEASQIFHSSAAEPGGSNYVGFRNEEADKIIEENRVTFDYAKRVELNRRLEHLLWEESPYTFMFSFDELYFYSPKFRNVKLYSLSPGYDFTQWYVDPDWQRSE